jgi:hypothetical protein
MFQWTRLPAKINDRANVGKKDNSRMLTTAQVTMSMTAHKLLVTTFTRHAKNSWTQEAIIP